MSYSSDLEREINYQKDKAVQIVGDIQSSVDLFFCKKTDSKTLKNLIEELRTIVDYTTVCLFKERQKNDME